MVTLARVRDGEKPWDGRGVSRKTLSWYGDGLVDRAATQRITQRVVLKASPSGTKMEADGATGELSSELSLEMGMRF